MRFNASGPLVAAFADWAGLPFQSYHEGDSFIIRTSDPCTLSSVQEHFFVGTYELHRTATDWLLSKVYLIKDTSTNNILMDPSPTLVLKVPELFSLLTYIYHDLLSEDLARHQEEVTGAALRAVGPAHV